MARAMAMRCRWPPENSCGKRLKDGVGHAGVAQRLAHPVDPFAAVGADAVDDQPFLDDLADRHARVERGERVLEDDLHALSAAAAFACGPCRGSARRRRRSRRPGCRSAGSAPGRTWSCPSRIRRPAPASRGACSLRLEVVDGDELEEVGLEEAAALEREGDLDVARLRESSSRVLAQRIGDALAARRPAGAWCRRCCGLANSASVRVVLLHLAVLHDIDIVGELPDDR